MTWDHDLGDEPPPALRDRPPSPLEPFDRDAPVSGHVPVPPGGGSLAHAPEHDWSAAAGRIFPALRQIGLQGLRMEGLTPASLAAEGLKTHAQPLVDEGPCGLPIVFAISADRFDVLVNADHLLSWGVSGADIRDTAYQNLAAWSAGAAWSVEESGGRRLVSSATGEGWDASRILLPDARAHLAAELGGDGRVLIGLPERHLLLAGSLRPGDEEFASLFAEFVLEQSGGSDEPIDRRVFELVDDRLVEFAG